MAEARFSPAQQAMIHLVATTGPLSRTRLAEALGVGKPALTALARSLIAAGIVRETREAAEAPRQGRPAMLLDLNPAYGCFAGVAIGAGAPALVLTDLAGRVLARTPLAPAREPEAVAEAIAAGVASMKPAARAGALLGIGVAISGLVDAAQERCLASAELDWHDVPLAWLIRARCGLPAWLENDAKTAAIEAALFGAGRGLGDFALVTLGDSIGSAAYAGGRLRRGHNGGAGEIAHMTAEPEGAACRCGRRGCLDTVASRRAMLVRAREAGLDAADMAGVEALAARGDAAALDILHRAGTALGLAIAAMVQINDPQAVFVVDTQEATGRLLRTIVERTVRAHVLPELAAGLDLRFTRAGADFWPRMAASVAAHRFLVGEQAS